MVERVSFEPAQRNVYETIRLSMHERVRRAIEDNGWARGDDQCDDTARSPHQIVPAISASE